MPVLGSPDVGSASFRRGLGVLVAVAEAGEARADEIAEDLGVPLSTVYRYLRTLRELDLVEERDRSYVPGWRLLELAGQDVARTRLVEFGHAVLRELSRSTGETAVLTVRAGRRALCLRQVEAQHPDRLAFRIGQLLPLYAGAGQRVLLAHAPDAVIDQVLGQPRWQGTDRSRPAALVRRELAEIRTAGFVVSRGELNVGAVAVAVPVIADGEVVCALTVAGPQERCVPPWHTSTRAALQVAAGQLAAVLETGRAEPAPRGP